MLCLALAAWRRPAISPPASLAGPPTLSLCFASSGPLRRCFALPRLFRLCSGRRTAALREIGQTGVQCARAWIARCIACSSRRSSLLYPRRTLFVNFSSQWVDSLPALSPPSPTVSGAAIASRLCFLPLSLTLTHPPHSGRGVIAGPLRTDEQLDKPPGSRLCFFPSCRQISYPLPPCLGQGVSAPSGSKLRLLMR